MAEWTKAQTNKLIALSKSKKFSRAQIAEKLGVTRNSVIGKLYRLKKDKAIKEQIKKGKQANEREKWYKEDIIFLKNYVSKGMTTTNIARMMRRTEYDVIRKMDELEI